MLDAGPSMVVRVGVLALRVHHHVRGPRGDYLGLGGGAIASWAGVPGPGESFPDACWSASRLTWLVSSETVKSLAGLFVGTVIFATAQALLFPGLMTLAINRAPHSEMGQVVGTPAFMSPVNRRLPVVEEPKVMGLTRVRRLVMTRLLLSADWMVESRML